MPVSLTSGILFSISKSSFFSFLSRNLGGLKQKTIKIFRFFFSIYRVTIFFIHPSTLPFIYPSIHSFIHPFFLSFFYPSIHITIHPFIHPLIYPFIHPYINLPIHSYTHKSSLHSCTHPPLCICHSFNAAKRCNSRLRN